MVKRGAICLAVLLVVAAVVYPYQGIWYSGQIVSASVDGQAVPRERIAELYWDLQRSRLADAYSKCVGWVDLELRSGAHRQGRLRPDIALERWVVDFP